MFTNFFIRSLFSALSFLLKYILPLGAGPFGGKLPQFDCFTCLLERLHNSLLTVIFSQQRFSHPFMASCVTVGKLAIGLFVITCNQDVFLLWVLLGSSLSFLFCGFTATGLSEDFFFSFIYVLLVCVVISHEFKKNSLLIFLYIFSIISF